MTKEASPPSRRRRTLSAEEHALWHAVAKSTMPLKRGARRRKRVENESNPARDLMAQELTEAVDTAERRPHVAKRPEKRVEKPSPPPLAPLSRREKSRLSRGRHEIDARIDLHGMTQTRAHRALLSFLQRAYSDGATFVLVITGKGRTTAPESERGVLRRQVPLWLALPEFRAFVVSYEEAHIGHGGGGALYVRLRRAR
jgi:DNA-nicking Smr family endonuclease